MSFIKETTAALVLALAAAPAGAQAPAPAPAPAPQQGGGQALTQEQLQALGPVWAYIQLQASLGDHAASHGAAADVKQYGTTVRDENRTLASELAARLAERGTKPESLPRYPDADRVYADGKQLLARSGEDLDRAFVAFMKLHGPGFVDLLKRARDVTKGSDAALKKWLDDAENREERYLTQARELDSKQRQARTPPKR